MIQLDFFTNSENDLLRQDVAQLRTEQGNIRRGLFKRFNDLGKMFIKQGEELDRLKAYVYDEHHRTRIELEKFVIGE